MGRKHLLEHLISPSTETPPAALQPATVRKAISRGVGLVGAMSESVETMAADLKDAKQKIEGGDLVVEIPTDLIDPSFIADRIGDDEEMEAFVASIRDQGQRTPILLRPHPEKPGRYQIAFGHRRFRAARQLQRPVKALVKPLSDEELVVAQGQENQDRLDLSFIERAMFSAALEARGFLRDVICSALSVDKTEVSRMISVGTSLPPELILAIGPAQNTGRRKWMDLAKAFEQIDWQVEQERVLAACRNSGGKDSDERFAIALKSLLVRPKSKEGAGDREPTSNFKVDKKPGVIRIRFDEANLPKDVVEDLVSRVRDVCSKFGVNA